MSDTQTEDQDVRGHQEEVAGLLPALAQLDRTAAELEEKTASGQEVTTADVSAYEQQAAYARHLVDAAGADHREVAEAEKEHRGDGDKGFAARGLDHAARPAASSRPYPRPTTARTATARTRKSTCSTPAGPSARLKNPGGNCPPRFFACEYGADMRDCWPRSAAPGPRRSPARTRVPPPVRARDLSKFLFSDRG